MANRLTRDTVAEERPEGPRLEGWATARLAPTLRDASLRDAPQGEVVLESADFGTPVHAVTAFDFWRRMVRQKYQSY
jgi:hypothetical protein